MPTSNAAFFHLEPGEYICFVDRSTVDVTQFAQQTLPEGVVVRLIALTLKPGQSITEAVLIQKMDEMDEYLLSKHGSPWDELAKE